MESKLYIDGCDLVYDNYTCIHFEQGCSPTVTRAMVVNAAQLGTYSQAKQFLLSTGIYTCHVCFSVLICWCSSLCLEWGVHKVVIQ